MNLLKKPVELGLKEKLYLCELLGICEVIDSDGQKHVEECVWLFVISGNKIIK